MQNLYCKTLIVGAGLCGLTLAQQGVARGERLFVIEKSKGVGGRMATRRAAAFVFDHGAQYFKHSDKEPFPWMARWTTNGKAEAWFSEGDTQFVCGRGGMTSLAKDLAEGLPVRLNERVARLVRGEGRVQVVCESGMIFEAERVVLTCPTPQSLELLRVSSLTFPSELETICYAKALVGLFSLEQCSSLVSELIYRKGKDEIFSIANNRSKGLGHEVSLTVVMNPHFSEKFFDASDAETLQQIQVALIRQVLSEVRVREAQLKKWRYSHPEAKWAQSCVDLYGDRQVILAGDGFGGGSLSGAVRSAQSVSALFGW